MPLRRNLMHTVIEGPALLTQGAPQPALGSPGLHAATNENFPSKALQMLMEMDTPILIPAGQLIK